MMRMDTKISKTIESLNLVEEHLAQLKHHSSQQVKLLKQEQTVLSAATPNQSLDVQNTGLNAQLKFKLKGIYAEISALQKLHSEMEEKSKAFQSDTNNMFTESAEIICEAIENCLRK